MTQKQLVLKNYHLQQLKIVHDKIIEDPERHISVTDLAALASLNRKLLNYGFKEVYGITVNELRFNLRIERAITLLVETDKDLKQIARLTGYKNKHSFSKAFKKSKGIAPSKWRRLHSNRYYEFKKVQNG